MTLSFQLGRAQDIPEPTNDVNMSSIKHITAASQQRKLEYLSQARLWEGIDLSALDVVAGPHQSKKNKFEFDQEYTCKFAKAGKELGGNTPKFECEIGNDSFKVKYDNGDMSNGEVFGGVAGTRTLWLLGFYADDIYPIKVKCLGCPEDPFHGTGEIADRTYALATIERKSKGAQIELPKVKGWTWQEMDDNGCNALSGSDKEQCRTHYEALKLLGVFLQHGDRKSEQQKLMCDPEGIKGTTGDLVLDGKKYEIDETKLGTKTCDSTYAFIHDIGGSYGAGSRLSGSGEHMVYKEWASKTIFDEKEYQKSHVCKGNLTISLKAKGGMGNPIIRETGRKFLADQLAKLSQQNIRDIFIASRIAERSRPKNDDEKNAILDGWVKTFNDKVQQIASHTCQ